MMVKICGITNRADALAAIEGGASALGFNFYPRSPRYIDPGAAGEVAAGLPASVWKVGVFVNESSERMTEVAGSVGLDIVQVVGQGIPLPGLRVWQTAYVNDSFRLADIESDPAEAILLDTPAGEVYGGTGRTFDWSRAAGSRKRIILAGGLDASNVRRAIAAAQPWGVDVCSRIESSPGRKDHVKMGEFLREARS